MTKPPAKKSREVPRQIVGVSLPPDIARDFKEEAARQGISVRQLFLKMWASYKGTGGKRT